MRTLRMNGSRKRFTTDDTQSHYYSDRRGICKGDILIADIEELEKVDSSDIYPRRINAKGVLTPLLYPFTRLPFYPSTLPPFYLLPWIFGARKEGTKKEGTTERDPKEEAAPPLYFTFTFHLLPFYTFLPLFYLFLLFFAQLVSLVQFVGLVNCRVAATAVIIMMSDIYNFSKLLVKNSKKLKNDRKSQKQTTNTQKTHEKHTHNESNI